MNLLDIYTREELFAWYLENHDKVSDFWLCVSAGLTVPRSASMMANRSNISHPEANAAVGAGTTSSDAGDSSTWVK